jgi:O-antigen/teichoic acid export membrane protein
MQERKIYSNTLYQIITKLATSGLGFLATIFIARYFGAAGYGDFTKITAFIGLFYLLPDFGINAIFLQQPEQKSDFRNLVSLRIILSLLIIALVNGLLLLLPYNPTANIGFPPPLRLGVLIFSFTILSQALLTSAAAIFQKKLRYDLQTLAVSIGSFLTLIIVLIVSLLHLPLEYILAAYTVGGLVSSACALLFQSEKLLPLYLQKETAIQLLKDSLPLGLMLLFNLVYFRIDTIILSFYRTSVDVGIYGYAYKFFDFLIAIPLFLSNAIYPFLLKNQKNLRLYYSFSQKYILIFLLFSIIVLIPAWICAPLLAIVKAEFTPSIQVFRLLTLSLPIFFLTSILQWTLITQNQKLYLLQVYLFSALINTLLNLLFIPHFGYTASAIITGLSELIVLLLLYYKFIRMKNNLPPQA